MVPAELPKLVLRDAKPIDSTPRALAVGFDGQFATVSSSKSEWLNIWSRPAPSTSGRTARPWVGVLPGVRAANVTALSVGYFVGVVLLDDGSARAWRYGDQGPVPLEVPLSATQHLVTVSCVRDVVPRVVAVRSNGRAIAWEYALPSWRLVEPAALEREDVVVYAAVLGVGAKQVVAGQYARLALLSDGSVRAWAPGGDPYGQTRLPAEAQGNDIVDVGAGVGHFVALQQDGRLVAWGLNADGQAAVPREQGRGFYSVAVGWYHTLAISNNSSQLVAFGRQGVAAVPAAARRVTKVAAGSHQSVALLLGTYDAPPPPPLVGGLRFPPGFFFG